MWYELLVGLTAAYFGTGAFFVVAILSFAKVKGSDLPRIAAIAIMWVTWPVWTFLLGCLFWMILKARFLFPRDDHEY